jgi:hypothetical protein
MDFENGSLGYKKSECVREKKNSCCLFLGLSVQQNYNLMCSREENSMGFEMGLSVQ